MVSGSEKKTFASPDDEVEFENGSIRVISVGAVALARGTAKPGWIWSKSAKPTVNTESCQLHHHGWVISGRMHYLMDDGTELDFGPEDAFAIAPGHDAWVDGEEPFEYIEIIPRTRFRSG